MRPLTTWLAAVDAEHARLVRRDAAGFHTVRTLTSPAAHQKASDLVTGGLSRTFESASPTRHAIEPRSDPRHAARLQFAKTTAAALNEAARDRLFDRLVLAGPTRTLQLIEPELSPELRRHTTSVAKDLVKTPDRGLAEHFPNWPVIF